MPKKPSPDVLEAARAIVARIHAPGPASRALRQLLRQAFTEEGAPISSQGLDWKELRHGVPARRVQVVARVLGVPRSRVRPDFVIARLDKLSRDADVQVKLEAPDGRWDLVVMDEAHNAGSASTLNWSRAPWMALSRTLTSLCLILMERIVAREKISGAGGYQRRRAAISDAMVNYLIAFMLEGLDWCGDEVRMPASLILLIRHQLGPLKGDFHKEYETREAMERAAWRVGRQLQPNEKLSINRLIKLASTADDPIPRSTVRRRWSPWPDGITFAAKFKRQNSQPTLVGRQDSCNASRCMFSAPTKPYWTRHTDFLPCNRASHFVQILRAVEAAHHCAEVGWRESAFPTPKSR